MAYFIVVLLVTAIYFSARYIYETRKARGDPWTVEDLFMGSSPSLALDPTTGNPRISYYQGNHLCLASSDGSWSSEIVDDEDSGDVSSLALDPVNGYPKIAYRAYTPALDFHIRYAEWDGARWIIERVGALDEGHSAAYVCLALDPDSREPRIVYVDQTEASYLEVRYLARDGDVWTTEVVGPAGGSSAPSLAMTAAGEPRVAYRSACHIVFVARDEGLWVTEDVSTLADSGYDSSLRLRSDDAPVIAYWSSVPVGFFCADLLEFAQRGETRWNTERPVTDVVRGLSLALEPETDFPCISFYNKDENQLKYVSWDGMAWVEEFIDDAEGIYHSAMRSSLALSPGTNAPRVAYAATGSRIRFAWRD